MIVFYFHKIYMKNIFLVTENSDLPFFSDLVKANNIVLFLVMVFLCVKKYVSHPLNQSKNISTSIAAFICFFVCTVNIFQK